MDVCGLCRCTLSANWRAQRSEQPDQSRPLVNPVCDLLARIRMYESSQPAVSLSLLSSQHSALARECSQKRNDGQADEQRAAKMPVPCWLCGHPGWMPGASGCVHIMAHCERRAPRCRSRTSSTVRCTRCRTGRRKDVPHAGCC